MTILARLSLILIAVGLVAGVVLRRVWPRRTLLVVSLATAAPLVVHLLYMLLFWTPRAPGVAGAGAVFALSSLVLIGAGIGIAWWLLRNRALWLTLLPLAVAALYGVIPFLIFSRYLDGQGVRLDVIPTTLLAGAVLVSVGLLFSYLFPAPRVGPIRPWRWFRRR